MLTIVGKDYERSKQMKQTYVIVDCECGNKNHSTQWNKVKRLETKSCGCLKNRLGRKYKDNEIIITDSVCIIKTLDGSEFLFDAEYLDLIKNKFWYNHNGYLTHAFIVDGRTHYCSFHRMISGANENDIVDHIDRNTFNNQKHNLRLTNKIGNARNHNLSSNNTSGTSGVSWDKSRNKWSASITIKGKCVHIGRYDVKTDAIKARAKAELKYFGEYSPLYGGVI